MFPTYRSPLTALALALLLAAAGGAQAQAQGVISTKSALAKLNADTESVPSHELIQAASKPIPLDLKTNKKTYHNGEVIKLTISSPKGGHVRIYYSDAAGGVVCLFPSDEVTAAAAAAHVKVTDVIPAGKDVIISGPGSVTGIEVIVGPPAFGAEQISAVITDVPLVEDSAVLAKIKSSHSATDIALIIAAQAIRQDHATKSAVSRVNNDGVPLTLAGVGVQTVHITTKH